MKEQCNTQKQVLNKKLLDHFYFLQIFCTLLSTNLSNLINTFYCNLKHCNYIVKF